MPQRGKEILNGPPASLSLGDMSLQHFNTSWASSQWPWACVCQQAEVGPVDAVDVVDSSEEESGNCLEVKQKII